METIMHNYTIILSNNERLYIDSELEVNDFIKDIFQYDEIKTKAKNKKYMTNQIVSIEWNYDLDIHRYNINKEIEKQTIIKTEIAQYNVDWKFKLWLFVKYSISYKYLLKILSDNETLYIQDELSTILHFLQKHNYVKKEEYICKN